MSNLATEGFLSDQADAIIARVGSRYPGWKSLVRRINAFSVEQQFKLAFNSLDTRAVIAAALFARTIENTQAALILLERGMQRQSDAVLRVAMESLFLLGAIVKSEKFWIGYVKADAVARRKLAEKLQKLSALGVVNIASPDHIEELKRIAIDDIEEQKSRELSAYEASEIAGLLSWYLSGYSILSGPVHTTVRDLESAHVEFNAAGDPIGLRAFPVLDDLERSFLTASEILLVALEFAQSQFKGDFAAFLSEARASVTDLHTRPKQTL